MEIAWGETGEKSPLSALARRKFSLCVRFLIRDAMRKDELFYTEDRERKWIFNSIYIVYMYIHFHLHSDRPWIFCCQNEKDVTVCSYFVMEGPPKYQMSNASEWFSHFPRFFSILLIKILISSLEENSGNIFYSVINFNLLFLNLVLHFLEEIRFLQAFPKAWNSRWKRWSI